MIDSFEITNTTMIPSDDAAIRENGTVTENLTGFETQVTNTTGNVTYTQSGGRFLGELYISGDRYIDIQKPTGVGESCIDNDSNLTCDITEPNAPPSCRYDGVHCDMTGPTPNVTQGPLGSSFTTNIPPAGGINWIQTCQQLDAILIPSCSSLVFPNNVLTGEGERAAGCIRNGLLLAGGGTLLNFPLPVIIPTLQALSEPTGCGGIIEWENINNVGGLMDIIDTLT